jgi:hypothetical protein
LGSRSCAINLYESYLRAGALGSEKSGEKMSLKRVLIALVAAMSYSFAYGQSLETRATWMDHCPSEPPPAKRLLPLVGLVLPYLISAGVDYASAALTKAASDKADTSAATTDDYLFEINSVGDVHPAEKVRCLVVVRGTFDGANSAADVANWATGELGGLQQPYFRFEAKIVPKVSGNIYQMVPVYVKSWKPESPSIFAATARDYNLSVSLTQINASEPFASTTFNMKVASPGADGDLHLDQLKQMASGSLAFPSSLTDVAAQKKIREKRTAREITAATILDAEWYSKQPREQPRPDEFADPVIQRAIAVYCKNIQAKNRMLTSDHQYYNEHCIHDIVSEGENLEAAITRSLTSPKSVAWAAGVCKTYQPPLGNIPAGCGLSPNADPIGLFRTSVTLTETRHGAEWAKAFAKAVEDSKESIKSSAVSLLPSEREKAEQAAKNTARQASQGVLLADLAVEVAESELEELRGSNAKGSDIARARIELLKAKIARNDAYRKAGLPAPESGLG